MEGNGGFINPAYMGTLSTSTTSIPGEYRRITEDDLSSNQRPISTITIQNGAIKTVNGNLEKTASSNNNNIEIGSSPCNNHSNGNTLPSKTVTDESSHGTKKRENWGNDLEFLMSCIALSVGLGNVWRFPFTALDNGGGAFVIPYLIVLVLIGKPVYYMEMLLGQFSSRGSIKVFDFSPIMRGVGYGQIFGTAIVTTYYAVLMALTLRYLVDSFYPVLPWSYCREEWGDICLNSTGATINAISNETTFDASQVRVTSAEFYFTNIILREKDSIDDGIGDPSWSLSITLAVSWITVALILYKGIKSSGKASYFLAIFPYIIMFILLIRSLTLPGAFNGVMYFLKPQWDKLLDPKVWYAAVTQCFFSLAICFGGIIMYASYNRFSHNIYRDAMIVTTLDTFTSLLSGIIIFGILGNLAYENNTTDIRSVVKGGTGLAFISYPDAIAKFKFVPQLFAVLFFLMLYILSIGSIVGMTSSIMTVIKDQFKKLKHWVIIVGISIVGYLLGLMYITPGGQYVLNLLDFHGASFVALVLAIFELIAIGWIYGVKRLCRDVHFMLGIKTSAYFRICWAIITPGLMMAILIYTLVEYEPLQYNGYTYQNGVYIFAWCLSAFGIGQLLFWAIHAVRKQSGNTLCERILNAFKPHSNWGPLDPVTLKEYKYYSECNNQDIMFKRNGFWFSIYDNIFG